MAEPVVEREWTTTEETITRDNCRRGFEHLVRYMSRGQNVRAKPLHQFLLYTRNCDKYVDFKDIREKWTQTLEPGGIAPTPENVINHLVLPKDPHLRERVQDFWYDNASNIAATALAGVPLHRKLVIFATFTYPIFRPAWMLRWDFFYDDKQANRFAPKESYRVIETFARDIWKFIRDTVYSL